MLRIKLVFMEMLASTALFVAAFSLHTYTLKMTAAFDVLESQTPVLTERAVGTRWRSCTQGDAHTRKNNSINV